VATTIIVLRFLPALLVRAQYHWVNALSSWWSKKRQANWIIPLRTALSLAVCRRSRPARR
jgi:hypothetical protein